MTKLISELFETMCREQCLAKAGLRHLKLVGTKIVVGLSKRPCKIQCTFYCHRVVKIIAPHYVYVGPPPLGSK